MPERRLWVGGLLGLAVGAGAFLSPAGSARAQSVESLRQLSIEELGDVDVSSVTKSSESVRSAPAAIFVISHDDIVRSGATTLPEILRLAPNLQVYRTGASGYVITARGFNGNKADQAFSDKLLILIDGRSVYTPLFSGIYWDMQEVPPDEIERIEVISGPGATLWGANAVNGVINIVTKTAADTQGGRVEVESGNLQTSVGVRWGGRIGDTLAYRAYVRDLAGYDTPLGGGRNGHDRWNRAQGGFRLDWSPTAADSVTVQGDAYGGREGQGAGAPDESLHGRNLTAHWTHAFGGGSAVDVLAYYDEMGRADEAGGAGRFSVDTWDVEAQHHFSIGGWNDIVWGIGARFVRYSIVNTASLQFRPPRGWLNLGDLFVQDSLRLRPDLKLILGFKAEDDPYSGVTPLPSVRLAWTPSDRAMVWAAASRAIRSPTPFDVDVFEQAGPFFLNGNPNFKPETLTAYELGTRLQPTSRLSASVSAFYNVYDDLRSVEITPGTFVPIYWANRLKARTYGLDAWADYQVASWWRLSGSVSLLGQTFQFEPTATARFLGYGQSGTDPRDQAAIKSSMNLGHGVTLDGDLRWVDALRYTTVPGYLELNARIGWKVTDRVGLSLSGFNLLHDHHQEYPAPALPVPREVLAGVRWAF